MHRDELNFQAGCCTHPTSYSVATGSSLTGGKAANACEADCSGPSSVEVKYVGLYLVCNEAQGQRYIEILWLLTVV